MKAIARLLERRQLFIALEPQRMTAVCLGGRFGQRSRPVLSSVEAALSASPRREALSALLVSALPPASRPRTLTVTLSDLLVRYLALRRPDGLRGLRELRELAAQQLCECFELDAADWEFRVDTPLRGTHATVCAMPKALLQDLREAASETGLRLVSVQPRLAIELTRHGHGLRDGCMATVEHDGLAIARLAGKQPLGIRVVRSAQALQDLRIELRREAVLHDLGEHAPICLAGVASADRKALPAPQSAVCAERWPSEGPQWSERYRLALAPVWPRKRA